MENLKNWSPRLRPTNDVMIGQFIDCVPWSAGEHAQALWESFGGREANTLLFHFGWPQMKGAGDLAAILDRFNGNGDFVTCVFAEKKTGRALGMASYMAIVPEHGRVETGAVAHGTDLKHSRGATEAHYLMARRVFEELGYRRYEWKLNNPNEASHRAAKRLGFTYEGVFRQHQVMPYGNRDTAWYSMLDSEWPLTGGAMKAWLSPENFDAQGKQIERLEDLRAKLGSAT